MEPAQDEGLIRLVIVAIPGGAVHDELFGLMKTLCTLTGSRTAVTFPPHMTLRTGVMVPVNETGTFIREFGRIIEKEKAIRSGIKTEGLRAFSYWEEENQKFIILYSVRKSQALADLNKRLLGYERYKKSNKTVFQPHISLLYGDVDREAFETAKLFVSERPEVFDRGFSFDLDNITILSQADCGEWSLFHKYELGA
jgi:2'-5' RNA ligase